MNRGEGYTLVEVMISVLLTAVIVGAIFGIILSSQQSSIKVDRRTAANQYSRHISEMLAQYVTGDQTVGAATGNIIGPTGSAVGAASWYLTGIKGEDGRTVTDTVSGSATCNGTSCYALVDGTHTLSGFLPAWFEKAPYNATVTYYVALTGAGQSYSLSYGGGAGKSVNSNQANVTINWTEP